MVKQPTFHLGQLLSSNIALTPDDALVKLSKFLDPINIFSCRQKPRPRRQGCSCPPDGHDRPEQAPGVSGQSFGALWSCRSSDLSS